MYAIIFWHDDYLGFIQNENGSIKLFDSVSEADAHANKRTDTTEVLRVVSLEAIDGR